MERCIDPVLRLADDSEPIYRDLPGSIWKECAKVLCYSTCNAKISGLYIEYLYSVCKARYWRTVSGSQIECYILYLVNIGTVESVVYNFFMLLLFSFCTSLFSVLAACLGCASVEKRSNWGNMRVSRTSILLWTAKKDFSQEYERVE